MSYNIGIKCRACDAQLPEDHHDPEFCLTCLAVVAEYNKDIVKKDSTEIITELMEEN